MRLVSVGRLSGDDFFRKLAPGSGGSVHENGSCAGHMVPHGRGGLLGVTGFDRLDDARVPFDIHVSQRAIIPANMIDIRMLPSSHDQE